MALQASGLCADKAVPAGKMPQAGEIFGEGVSRDDFDFAYKTTGTFSLSNGEAATESEKRLEAWKHLILLRAADRQKISVSAEEIQKELSRLLAEKNLVYGSYAYYEWVRTTFGEDAKVLERRIENTLKVKKWLDKTLNPPPPVITDGQAKQKFLNQYNSMNTEFATFPTLAEAEAFYKKTGRKSWDEKKEKDPKFFTPTGHISLEAYIDLWQVPLEDATRIHAMSIDQIAAPAKMFKGYGVFRLKEKKDADLKIYDDRKKEEYFRVLKQSYLYNHGPKLVQDLFKEANMKDYERDKIIVMETTQGTVEFQLYTEAAPKACENLIGLAEKGYYNGTVFHRVIKGFMIQGGDPTATGRGGESIGGKPFGDEFQDGVEFNRTGLLAMANRGPNTNGSQFFITLGPTPHLNKKHTIFGEVITGWDVIQKIGDAATDSNDKPKTDQKILKMSLKKWPTSASS